MFTGIYRGIPAPTQCTESIGMDGWAKAAHAYGVQATKLQATEAICWSYFIFRTLVVVFTCVTLSHSVNRVCHNTEFF